ncbi:MAG TPA: hypothetical protein VFD00_01675 [Thermoclostridium sp.]|nr:hypothetical protein [Thermoclostridium sp.]
MDSIENISSIILIDIYHYESIAVIDLSAGLIIDIMPVETNIRLDDKVNE